MPNKRPLISPIDCKHWREHFISSASWGGEGDSGRYHVSVCYDCGQFHVSGWRNGQFFKVQFELCTVPGVEAAGRYLKYLNAEAEKES